MVSLSFVRRSYGSGIARKLSKLRAIDRRIQKDSRLPFAFFGAGMAQVMEVMLLRQGSEAFLQSYPGALSLLQMASMKGQFEPACLSEWRREGNKPERQRC